MDSNSEDLLYPRSLVEPSWQEENLFKNYVQHDARGLLQRLDNEKN